MDVPSQQRSRLGRRPGDVTGNPVEGTRLRILNTAERLFASEGAEAVTLRSIAAAANTNVAAVNYHFGTKERLFEEMFLRRLIPINERRLSMLESCLAEANGGVPDLRGIIRAFVTPPLESSADGNKSAQAIVVQFLLGRILAMPAVNQKLAQFYDELRQRFVAALRQVLPDQTESELVWRYYWMGGCVMCSLAIDPAISAGLVDKESAETHAETLITFLLAGCRGTPSTALLAPPFPPPAKKPRTASPRTARRSL